MAVDLTVYDRKKDLAQMMRDEAEAAFNRRMLERKVQADEQQAQNGGHDPAVIKIVNDMQAAAEMAGNASLPAMERQKAAHRYNLLNQVAKTYAIDRGMNAEIPGFYGAGGNAGAVPLDPGMSAPGGQQPLPLPAAFNQPGDALDENAINAMGDDWEAGLGGQQPAPRKAPMPLPAPTGGVTAIPGFAQTAGQIAATKKGMETDAANASDYNWKPKTANMVAQEGEVGKKIGETRAELGERVARMPQLANVTTRLSALGKLSTYTMAGRARDVLMREAGMQVPDAAAARKEYVSMVDNEVLPLLRQTFGAQFTVAEGESLRQTLGDPNASPMEKDRVLKSFIRNKFETANSMAREIGQAEPFAQEDIDAFVSGIGAPEMEMPGAGQQANPQAPAGAPQPGQVVDGYVFMGGDPGNQKSWKKVK